MTAKTEFSDGIDQKAFSPWRAALIVIIALLILIPANLRFGKQIFGRIKPYTVEANESNVRKALALIDLTTEEATIGVFWAGSIPYYSERKAIDFLGKSDEYIASLPPDLSEASGSSRLLFIPGHNKYDLTYSIQELKPTFIQNVRWKRQDLSQWAETNYEEVTHNGVRLFLLADSEQVKWQK